MNSLIRARRFLRLAALEVSVALLSFGFGTVVGASTVYTVTSQINRTTISTCVAAHISGTVSPHSRFGKIVLQQFRGRAWYPVDEPTAVNRRSGYDIAVVPPNGDDRYRAVWLHKGHRTRSPSVRVKASHGICWHGRGP